MNKKGVSDKDLLNLIKISIIAMAVYIIIKIILQLT